MRLRGKTAIITGGGSGIGEAIVRLLASHGAQVVIADLHLENASCIAQELSATGFSVTAIRTDVSQKRDVEQLIQQTLQHYGQLDIVVNNAAMILPRFLEGIEEEAWDRIFQVNLKSMFLMIKQAIPELRKTRGTIVNMASLNGLIGQAMNPAYAATKGGVIALTKSLAIDFAPDGVRVNCICPAGVSTPLLQQWIQEQDDPAATIQSLNDMHALGRPALTEEIAQAVLFFSDSASSFVTGVALPVDGGASLGY